MKNVGLLITLIFLCNSAFAQDNTAISLAFLNYMKKGNFNKSYSYFDKVITDKITTQNLEAIWSSVNVQVGEYTGSTGSNSEFKDSTETIIINGQFESGKLDIKFVYNAKHKIVGFFFLQPKGGASYVEPSYQDKSLYKEQDISLKIKGGLKLPGKFVAPNQSKLFPIVIFVQGSGPSDMDETLGPTKLFKDMSIGLAKYGIGSYRFDKRTKIYPEQFVSNSNYTVNDEVIEDIVSAINFCKKLEGVDSNSIYIIGHSLGGMLAPRINQLKPELKGLILMAANARPLEDLILEQITYIYSLDGLNEIEKNQIEILSNQLKLVKQLQSNEIKNSSELPLGLSASYWIDLNKYNQVETLSLLKNRTLILQGERDYQVTLNDFEIWHKGLAKRDNVVYKSYPLLNHMFIEGTGKSIPAEYNKAGNVPEYVIMDISNWIFSK